MVHLTNSVSSSVVHNSVTVLEQCAPFRPSHSALKLLTSLMFRTSPELLVAPANHNVKRNHLSKQSFLETQRKCYHWKRTSTTGTCNVTNRPLSNAVALNQQILLSYSLTFRCFVWAFLAPCNDGTTTPTSLFRTHWNNVCQSPNYYPSE